MCILLYHFHLGGNWATTGRDSMSLNCRDEGPALLHLGTISVTASLVLFLMVLLETGLPRVCRASNEQLETRTRSFIVWVWRNIFLQHNDCLLSNGRLTRQKSQAILCAWEYLIEESVLIKSSWE